MISIINEDLDNNKSSDEVEKASNDLYNAIMESEEIKEYFRTIGGSLETVLNDFCEKCDELYYNNYRYDPYMSNYFRISNRDCWEVDLTDFLAYDDRVSNDLKDMVPNQYNKLEEIIGTSKANDTLQKYVDEFLVEFFANGDNPNDRACCDEVKYWVNDYYN